jgi:hypothetical protein
LQNAVDVVLDRPHLDDQAVYDLLVGKALSFSPFTLSFGSR